MTEEMKQICAENGYYWMKELPDRGIVGLCRFAYTVGLVYGISEHFYEGRYCYPTQSDAMLAILKWDGVGDPDDDVWIKHKGGIGEYSNPKKDKNESKQEKN